MLPVVPVVICCVLAALSALGVVIFRRPVHVAVALLAHSLSLAALYMALDAQFSAMAQTLIYSGAIVVLFLIVVALLPTGGKEELGASTVVAGLAVLGSMGAAVGAALWALPALPTGAQGRGFTVKEVGAPLFGELLVPFELTAPLLLAAIVAAIALWRRQEARPGADARPEGGQS